MKQVLLNEADAPQMNKNVCVFVCECVCSAADRCGAPCASCEQPAAASPTARLVRTDEDSVCEKPCVLAYDPIGSVLCRTST